MKYKLQIIFFTANSLTNPVFLRRSYIIENSKLCRANNTQVQEVINYIHS